MQSEWEHYYDESSIHLQCFTGHGELLSVVLIFSILKIDLKVRGFSFFEHFLIFLMLKFFCNVTCLSHNIGLPKMPHTI